MALPLAFFVLCFSAVAAQEAPVAEDSVVADDAEAPAQSPLQKVVTMLQEMKAQVEKEADEDKAAYDKYACWCETVSKEKTAAVEEATARIEELTAFVQEAAAKEGQLKTEIEGLEADIAEDTQSLQTATSVRDKEKSDFETDEADMEETLDALKKAIEILSKVQLVQNSAGSRGVVAADDRHSASSGNVVAADDVQSAAEALIQVRGRAQRRFPQFKDVLQRDFFDLAGSLQDVARQLQANLGSEADSVAFLGNVFLPKREAVALDQAAQAPAPNELVGAAAGATSYNSRSGSIFGILQEMSDETARDLKEAREQETQAIKAFAKLREAKEGEIASATKQKRMKETQLADLVAKAATAKEDMAALQEAKAADEQLLVNLKESCAKESAAYEERTKARSDEVTALGEALKILTEDDARDLFGKTMSFLQTASGTSMSVAKDRLAERAMRRLAKVASKHKDVSLASLAVRVRLDAFTKVKEAMDKMAAELKAQQQEEYAKSEECKKLLDQTEDEIKVKTLEHKDIAEKHQSLSSSIDTITKEIEDLTTDVSDMESALKQASETRKSENQMFQQAVSDQRATVQILKKALARLEMFYGSTDAGAALVQVRVHARQEPGAAVAPPPPTPKGYSKSAGAGGVMQVFQMIIKDAEVVESDLEAAEQKAQTDYATYAADTTASIEADHRAIEEKEKQKAEAEGAKSETEESQSATAEALGKLEEMLTAHHLDCDWLLKYFEVRQQARAEEIDAIADAKAILSGASL